MIKRGNLNQHKMTLDRISKEKQALDSLKIDLSSRDQLKIQPQWRNFHEQRNPDKKYFSFHALEQRIPRRYTITTARQSSRKKRSLNISEKSTRNRNKIISSAGPHLDSEKNIKQFDQFKIDKLIRPSIKASQNSRKKKQYAKNIHQVYLQQIQRIKSMRSKRNNNVKIQKKDDQNQQTIRIRKRTKMNGRPVTFMIIFDRIRLIIIADFTDGDPKVIKIPRKQAFFFIQQECNGNIQLIFDHLEYDENNHILYLLSKQAKKNVIMIL